MDHDSRPTRSRTPVRFYPLREQPGDDLSTTTTAEERVAMMWPLAVEAWVMSGRRVPPNDRTVARLVMRPKPGVEDGR